MLTRRLALAAALGLGSALATAPAFAQGDWPNRPVTIIVPFSPGGATDITARILAEALAGQLGEAFVVENRTGAAGQIGVEAVVRAEPDGYTLLFATQGTMTVNPHIYDLKYDTRTDLMPISQTFSVDHVMVVNPSLGVSTVQEFVDLAKSKPGDLSYGSAGIGSFLQLTTVMLEQDTGIELNHVPYKGSAAAAVDLLSGDINMVMDSVPSSLGQIEAGKLVPLAVTSIKRNPKLPDVPTMAEAGVEGYGISSWGGLMAPKGTDPAIIAKLSKAVQEAYADAEVQAKFEERGLGAVASTPEGFKELLDRDYESLGKVIKSAGIKVN